MREFSSSSAARRPGPDAIDSPPINRPQLALYAIFLMTFLACSLPDPDSAKPTKYRFVPSPVEFSNLRPANTPTNAVAAAIASTGMGLILVFKMYSAMSRISPDGGIMVSGAGPAVAVLTREASSFVRSS